MSHFLGRIQNRALPVLNTGAQLEAATGKMALHRTPKVAFTSSIFYSEHHFPAGKNIAYSHADFRETDYAATADSIALKKLQTAYNICVTDLRDKESTLDCLKRNTEIEYKHQKTSYKKKNVATEAASLKQIRANELELGRQERALVEARKAYLQAQEAYYDKRASTAVKPSGLQKASSTLHNIVFRPTRAGVGEFQPADMEAHVFSGNEISHSNDPNGIHIEPNTHGLVIPEFSLHHLGQTVVNDLPVVAVDVVGLASALASLKTITTACALEKGVQRAISELEGVIDDLGLKKAKRQTDEAHGKGMADFIDGLDPQR